MYLNLLKMESFYAFTWLEQESIRLTFFHAFEVDAEEKQSWMMGPEHLVYLTRAFLRAVQEQTTQQGWHVLDWYQLYECEEGICARVLMQNNVDWSTGEWSMIFAVDRLEDYRVEWSEEIPWDTFQVWERDEFRALYENSRDIFWSSWRVRIVSLDPMFERGAETIHPNPSLVGRAEYSKSIPSKWLASCQTSASTLVNCSNATIGWITSLLEVQLKDTDYIFSNLENVNLCKERIYITALLTEVGGRPSGPTHRCELIFENDEMDQYAFEQLPLLADGRSWPEPGTLMKWKQSGWKVESLQRELDRELIEQPLPESEKYTKSELKQIFCQMEGILSRQQKSPILLYDTNDISRSGNKFKIRTTLFLRDRFISKPVEFDCILTPDGKVSLENLKFVAEEMATNEQMLAEPVITNRPWGGNVVTNKETFSDKTKEKMETPEDKIPEPQLTPLQWVLRILLGLIFVVVYVLLFRNRSQMESESWLQWIMNLGLIVTMICFYMLIRWQDYERGRMSIWELGLVPLSIALLHVFAFSVSDGVAMKLAGGVVANGLLYSQQEQNALQRLQEMDEANQRNRERILREAKQRADREMSSDNPFKESVHAPLEQLMQPTSEETPQYRVPDRTDVKYRELLDRVNSGHKYPAELAQILHEDPVMQEPSTAVAEEDGDGTMKELQAKHYPPEIFPEGPPKKVEETIEPSALEKLLQPKLKETKRMETPVIPEPAPQLEDEMESELRKARTQEWLEKVQHTKEQNELELKKQLKHVFQQHQSGKVELAKNNFLKAKQNFIRRHGPLSENMIQLVRAAQALIFH